MNTPAKAAYLTALLGQSQQREQRCETALAAATTRPDTQAGIARLTGEQARQQALRAELAALPGVAVAGETPAGLAVEKAEKGIWRIAAALYENHGFPATIALGEALGLPFGYCEPCDNETATLAGSCLTCGSTKA